jgi:hypothetical protein
MIDTATNMGISATAGFVFRQYAEAQKQRFKTMMAALNASEDSRKAAESRGGTWIRRCIISIVAVSFIAAVIAGFFDKDVVLESQLDRKILFFEWDVVKHHVVKGVVILKENRAAFESIVGFYFGQSIK